jgi:hypothetical protein
MSKLVNWGHWAVAVLFGVGGLALLAGDIANVIHDVMGAARGETISFYPVYMGLLWSLLTLLCSWGILKWRLWAHHLALFFSVVDVVTLVAFFFLMPGGRFGAVLIGTIIGAVAVTAWLLLPTVRTEYARRTLTA